MNPLTLVSAAAAPVALKRTRSRSVRIPIGRSPSTITTEPFLRSAIRCDTSAIVSEAWPVTAGELITSATVRTVLVLGMRPPYRAHRGPGHGREPLTSDNVHRPATRCSSDGVGPDTPRRDGVCVNPLTTFVRSLGNHRALANAQAVL